MTTNTITPGTGISISCTNGVCTITSTGGGSTNGSVTAASQFLAAYYSNPGSTTTVSGFSPVTFSTSSATGVAITTPTIITSTGSTNALRIKANGLYGTTNGTSGGLSIDCTGGGASSGMCAQFYSNAGAQLALAGLVNVVNDNSAWNEPMIYFQDASSANGHPQMRIDALAPNVEIVNTSLGGSVKYEFAIPAAGDYFQWNGRDNANSSFKDILRLHRYGGNPAIGGALGFNALQMMTTGQVLFNDSTDAHYVGFKGANTIPANVSWTLPTGDNTGAMQSDGAGTLNFSKVSLSSAVSGTVQAGNFPALTGDVTSPAGSLATTAASIQSNIRTLTSSITVTGADGIGVTYGVVAGTISANSQATGELDLPEGSDPTNVSVSGQDIFWASSSSHTLVFNPNGTSTYTVVGASATIAAGHLLKAGTTPGSAIDGGTSSGGGTPATPTNSIQYNGGGTFAGSNNFQINGTSMTIVSSASFTSNGSQNSAGGYGFVDVYHGSANTNQLLFAVGSQSQNNQFYVPNQGPIYMGSYGAQVGNMGVGEAANPQRIFSESRNNYIEVERSSTMTFNTDNDISGGDMVFLPQSAEAFRVSALTGVSARTLKGMSVTYGLSVGSMTGAGLSTCGDSTHALAWNSSTSQFSCQALSGGGGGSTSINAAAQFSVPYYSLAGTTTTLSGYPGVTLSTSTGVTISTAVVMSSSGSIGPFTTMSLSGGGILDTTAGTMALGPLSASGSYGNSGDILTSGGAGSAVAWSSAPTISSITITGGAVIPTASQNFGAATMNQWFTSVAANQNAPAAGALNNLVWMGMGDSHMSDNNITRPFVGNMQANFGNAGEWFPLSNAGEQNIPSRPNSCSSYTVVGTWINLNQQSNAHGLEDDEVQTSTVGASISATCGGSDTVIFHYVKQPSGGTIKFSVDGSNALTFPTANASVAVASMVITGLTYGVHTASVSYVTSGTAGIAATDFVFYSTGTPGFVNYRIGAYGSQAGNVAAQDQTQYVNLLNMMPAPPSIVLISFGTNEAAANTPPTTMMTNIHTIMSRIKTAWPNIDCAYMTEPDAQNSSLHTYSSSQYASALLQASVNDGCAFIDFTAFFSSEPYFSKYYSDGVHLTPSGGLVAGNMLTNIFSNQSGDITPFTFNASSGVLSWGTNISTASLNNAASFGYSNIISSSAVGAGAFGNYLTNNSSSTLYLGYAHLTSSGTKPTAGACGTTPVIAANSTDRAGAITWSGNAATCVINYGTTWGQSPFCVANSTATPVGVTSTRTAQTLTFVTPGLFASTATWHCEGGQGQ